MTAPMKLATTGNPQDGLLELPTGFINRDGYPVDRFGRPDWCSKCAALEIESRRIDPSFRPQRVVHERTKGGDVPLGLCKRHQDNERNMRDERRAARGTTR